MISSRAPSTFAAAKVHNSNDIWKDLESALVSAIRADPKGLQAIKPRRLLHLLHNPASVINKIDNNNDHIIKSLYKATGLESDSDSDSDSESDIQQAVKDANLQEDAEDANSDMIADFLEGELLQHEATSCNITTSPKFSSTSNYIKSGEKDYKHKLELSKQKLRAGYATQQKAKQQHQIKVINTNAAKTLMLAPKRTITKKITHCTTPKTKPSLADFTMQQTTNYNHKTSTATRQIRCSASRFYPNYSAHSIYSSGIRT